MPRSRGEYEEQEGNREGIVRITPEMRRWLPFLDIAGWRESETISMREVRRVYIREARQAGALSFKREKDIAYQRICGACATGELELGGAWETETAEEQSRAQRAKSLWLFFRALEKRTLTPGFENWPSFEKQMRLEMERFVCEMLSTEYENRLTIEEHVLGELSYGPELLEHLIAGRLDSPDLSAFQLGVTFRVQEANAVLDGRSSRRIATLSVLKDMHLLTNDITEVPARLARDSMRGTFHEVLSVWIEKGTEALTSTQLHELGLFMSGDESYLAACGYTLLDRKEWNSAAKRRRPGDFPSEPAASRSELVDGGGGGAPRLSPPVQFRSSRIFSWLQKIWLWFKSLFVRDAPAPPVRSGLDVRSMGSGGAGGAEGRPGRSEAELSPAHEPSAPGRQGRAPSDPPAPGSRPDSQGGR